MSAARTVFDTLLASFGFKLSAEHVDYESFGTAWVEYYRRGLRLRLVWDGKEGFLLVLVANAEEQRRTSEWLEYLVRGKVSSADVARAPERVAELSDLTRHFLNGQRRRDYAPDPGAK
jgi:hypothetical protein